MHYLSCDLQMFCFVVCTIPETLCEIGKLLASFVCLNSDQKSAVDIGGNRDAPRRLMPVRDARNQIQVCNVQWNMQGVC